MMEDEYKKGKKKRKLVVREKKRPFCDAMWRLKAREGELSERSEQANEL